MVFLRSLGRSGLLEIGVSGEDIEEIFPLANKSRHVLIVGPIVGCVRIVLGMWFLVHI